MRTSHTIETGQTGRTLSREDIGEFVRAYMTTGRFNEDFDSLQCKERIDVVCKLLPYTLPKLRCTDPDAQASETEPGLGALLQRILTTPPDQPI